MAIETEGDPREQYANWKAPEGNPQDVDRSFPQPGQEGPLTKDQEDLYTRREEALAQGKVLHEDVEAGESNFIKDARQKVEYWDGVIKEYQATIEELKTAKEDRAGNIRNKSGDAVFRKEAIAGVQKLIEEAKKAKDKEESKLVSKL